LIHLNPTFKIQNSKFSIDGYHRWVHHWKLPDGEITLSLARSSSGYLLRFPDQTDFLISEDGLNIQCHPAEEATKETIDHYYWDQILPRILSHQGNIIIHSGAVAIDNQAIAFLGETGYGKSTLATAFHQHGTPMLADDCIQLNLENDQVMATPLGTGTRLWPDTIKSLFKTTPAQSQMAYYSTKKRLTLSSKIINTPLPLKVIFILEAPDSCKDDSQIKISPITKQNALMNLLKQSFQLDVTDQQKNENLFNSLADIIQHLPTYRLCYPRKYSLLPEVQNEIKKWIAIHEN